MPTSTTSARFRARAASAALAALLLSLGGLLSASPASAHDELVSSDPAADVALDALPAQIAMTFSGEIATDPGATEVQVTDASGAALADGEPVVQSNVVTQPLTGEASGAEPISGTVTVLWKVVSSDGHPISGQYSFTVSGAPSPTASPTETTTASPAPVESPSEEASTAPPIAPEPADEDATSTAEAWPWVVGGLILVGVAGAVLYLLTSRARRQRALAENRENALGGAPGSASPGDADSRPAAGSADGSDPRPGR